MPINHSQNWQLATQQGMTQSHKTQCAKLQCYVILGSKASYLNNLSGDDRANQARVALVHIRPISEIKAASIPFVAWMCQKAADFLLKKTETYGRFQGYYIFTGRWKIGAPSKT